MGWDTLSLRLKQLINNVVGIFNYLFTSSEPLLSNSGLITCRKEPMGIQHVYRLLAIIVLILPR